MIIVHLGVIVQPYTEAQGHRGKPITTGDVAKILEEKYHIMETFAKMRRGFMAEKATESMTQALKSILLGAPLNIDPLGAFYSTTQAELKLMLSARAFDGQIPGTPTGAAKRGVDHRKKHPYAKRPERPSFLDTTLYQSSIIAWREK